MFYFTSDTHFGSFETIITDNRPFSSNKQFERFIIKTWNKQIKPYDTIYILGDYVDCHSTTDETWRQKLNLVKKLKANIVLIMGNNENRIKKYFFKDDFNAFREYCIHLGFKDIKISDTISIAEHKFYLTHKPKEHHPEILTLFGHSHRAMGVYKSFGFNICCDLNHFQLYSENDILSLLEMKSKYWDKDENLKLI